MNAWQIQSAQIPKHVEMRSVLTLVTVQSLPSVLQGTTEEFVHVTLAIQETRMALSVQRVSFKSCLSQLGSFWRGLTWYCSTRAWPWLCNWWRLSQPPSLHYQARLWRMCQPLLRVQTLRSKCQMWSQRWASFESYDMHLRARFQWKRRWILWTYK